MRLLWVVAISFLAVFQSVTGQSFLTKPSLKSATSKKLSETFSQYYLYSTEENENYKNSESDFTLNLGEGITASLKLSTSQILADNYIVSTSEGVSNDIHREDLAIPYKGYVIGDPSSLVRITVDRNYIYGYILYNKKKYFIEPAFKFDKSLGAQQHVIYQEDHVKTGQEVTCASTISKQQEKKTSAQFKSSASCQIAELAIAVGYNYIQEHGGSLNAINQTIAVMNMVAGVYENAFSDDIRFEIVEHFTPGCSSCNPWTNSTDANTLLNSFSSWGPGGFTLQHDIGQLWTARNICGPSDCSVAGLAWIDAVCGSYRYHILEDFTSSAWQLRILVSHEMGHNFGATHDGSSSPHIMRPSIEVNTTTWSSQSVSEINSALNGLNCFEDCVIGSCTEITNVSTSNCTPGTPSVYNLTLEIRHGGGGTSSSFDVMVNGQSFTHSWQASPQIVVISGLIADGTIANIVTIAANDGSDNGCSGAITYDEPSGNCNIAVTEDFNNCVLPQGWTTESTNIYTWNGGDPLIQFEWKFDDATRAFGNYDDAQNSSSLLTIDGSCMALMDDDIIFHNLYTGNVTLNSPVYNLSDFDTIKLNFDYNFHPFEDGGKGANNSSFVVQVFDGSNWTTVLTDTDSSCPWSNVWPNACTTYANLDLSSYANPDFRFRFIYSDGNNGAWAGMVALDNIDLQASVTISVPTCSDGIMNGDETGVDCGGSCSPCEVECEPIVIITPATPPGTYEAENMITTSGSVTLTETMTWSATNIEISSEFQISANTEFYIDNNGCGQE